MLGISCNYLSPSRSQNRSVAELTHDSWQVKTTVCYEHGLNLSSLSCVHICFHLYHIIQTLYATYYVFIIIIYKKHVFFFEYIYRVSIIHPNIYKLTVIIVFCFPSLPSPELFEKTAPRFCRGNTCWTIKTARSHGKLHRILIRTKGVRVVPILRSAKAAVSR